MTVILDVNDIDFLVCKSASYCQGGHWSDREKSGKFYFSARSGKSQGILQIGQGNLKYQESQRKIREFHNVGPKFVLSQVF